MSRRIITAEEADAYGSWRHILVNCPAPAP